MEEESNNGAAKQKSKSKGERRRSKPELDSARDEIKQFKENLLQSIATGDGSSIISESGGEITIPQQPRSRSASKAREALHIPDNVLAELDETKIFELKEAFLLFDMDGDGYIDFSDLRATLVSLGEKIDEQVVRNMLSEASNPLDFDAFVNLLGYKTLELDSEETLVAALSRWDQDNTGYIPEERIRHDLMTWGDRFTEKEADYALDEAPIVQKNGTPMIDYVRFCSQLCGLRKANKSNE
ncbi:myosin regulatory light chain, smooth muscle [Galleria mellonella]|uniref:Myosin regulatory light chain, smooth muscle n=1 Tax=Galleria mellonella TaxID=7137 RepID=A0A6J3CDB9_GALME|nr:myosin regulatory light chain, smooth muscle [Galleria mellonella]